MDMLRDALIKYQVTGSKLCMLFVFLVMSFSVSVAHAHKVHIFAYVDGELVKTESRFNGGRPARNCKVTVQSVTSQDVVLEGKSNDKGFFQFPVPTQKETVDIIISCGDGHRGTWRLASEDFFPVADQHDSHKHNQARRDVEQITESDDVGLRKIVAEEVEKKLAPLRRDLARLAEKKTTIQDILAGIGYLLGLAGLAAYMKYKKEK